MPSPRSLQALSAVERRALWHHARRRGQCVRCFHASVQRSAEHEVSGPGASQEESDKGSPKANLVENVQARPNPPDSFDSASPHQPTKPASMQDRKRHQRSAMISEEVKMIQRDHPSPTFAGDNPNTNSERPPPTAQTTNPEGSRMGENDPVTREGPLGQGVGKAVATEDDVPDSSIMARGARSPTEGVEEPAAGGAAVVGTPLEGRQTAPLVEENEAAVEEAQKVAQEQVAQKKQRVAVPDAVEPSKSISKEDLLHNGYETSTPAGGDMQSTILDHIRLVANPGESQNSERSPQQLALKMMAGQLVHFSSVHEKETTNDIANKILERSGEKQSFRPVSASTQKSIIDRLARGVYDPDGLMQGKQKYKNAPVLNDLARQAMKNSTYMTSDGDRFLRKVQSLLPRAEVQRQTGAPKPQQQAKAS